jgi:hypothetical protein
MADGAGFLVNILDVCGRPHDASLNVAMHQPKSMTQFMDHHLNESFQQYIVILFQSVLLVFQPVNGSNPGSSVQKGLSENIGKNGNKQIHPE